MPYDLTRELGIAPEMLLHHKDMMKVFFARLGQTGTAADDMGGQFGLGPLALIDPARGLPAIIQEILGTAK